ncbi:MAG: GIN domain-containing protein [Solirubrobacteraceae bacterium]
MSARRRSVAVALAAGVLLGASGCDNGPPVSQTRELGAFTRLEVSGDINLDVGLLNRPEPGARITAGEKAIDRIRTEVVGDTLKVTTKSRGLTIGPDPLGDVSVSLGVPALLGLRVDGSADVMLSGLSAKQFELRVNGSGDVRARGRVDDIELEVDGSADTNLKDLATKHAIVRIDGSGDTDLRVASSLELVLEGSGDVTYRGRPSVSSRLEGSGDVRQLDQ